jgi:hypothetical protein
MGPPTIRHDSPTLVLVPRRSVAAHLLPQRAKLDLRVTSTTAALSAEIQGVSTQVTQLQADMDKIKEALGIPEAGGHPVAVLCETGFQCSAPQVLSCGLFDRYDSFVIVKRAS